ncbi:MAG: type II secretion system protein [Spirochaetota bacterium]
MKILNSNSRAFTMIETLVVIGIITLLSTTLIMYSRTGESQIVLFKEQAKVVALLIKARSLSIITFGDSDIPCNYGVHFSSPDTVILFKEFSSECSNVNKIYDSSEEKIEEIKLDSAVKFGELELADVVFIPPDPQVIIDGDPSKQSALVKIKTVDGSAEKTIKITNAGQITTQ